MAATLNPRVPPQTPSLGRNLAMLRKYLNGATLKEVACENNISTTRVSQITWEYRRRIYRYAEGKGEVNLCRLVDPPPFYEKVATTTPKEQAQAFLAMLDLYEKFVEQSHAAA